MTISQKKCSPHHWIIPTAQGPTSLGVCRRCKKKKPFRNAGPDGGLTLMWSDRKEALDARDAARSGHATKYYQSG
jgi:hypothetical protein